MHAHLYKQRNFFRSVFPCCTINLGDQVCCYKHRDVLNCPFGWCAITALGKFDAAKGGHLILWDLKLVINFPAGATVLIPSATLVHSNTPVAANESRLSFTQYCAGPILRFVDQGFRTEKMLRSEDPEMYQSFQASKPHRWQQGMALFSTMEELIE